jgi:hypothetical protein
MAPKTPAKKDKESGEKPGYEAFKKKAKKATAKKAAARKKGGKK